VRKWKDTMTNERGSEHMKKILQKIGVKLMQKIQQRLLLIYAQELIKWWDKQHDAWIAQLENDALNRASGLRGFMSILKKWDQQKWKAMITTWIKKLTDTKQVSQALMLIQGIMKSWDKQTKKSILMTFKAKMKVSMGKIKLAQKKESAQKAIDQQTLMVKKEVTKMVSKSRKEFDAKEEELKTQNKKLERDILKLQKENKGLRDRLEA